MLTHTLRTSRQKNELPLMHKGCAKSKLELALNVYFEVPNDFFTFRRIIFLIEDRALLFELHCLRIELAFLYWHFVYCCSFASLLVKASRAYTYIHTHITLAFAMRHHKCHLLVLKGNCSEPRMKEQDVKCGSFYLSVQAVQKHCINKYELLIAAALLMYMKSDAHCYCDD
jgi:hypothetical protein